ncbi:hypothetical protein [Nitratireductor sp. StC3]|uniref:hypothetical protein n=1 Tax=Nitratireductor sp. StC3 TaxID=2126741 RepID=UPI000D0DDFE2|nr:hypothetical protein [Nitratireductor sp. StC3]PSM16687.1 hypothetical protein C7T96_18590 [Nitratireductor sp. StC3]
MNTVEWLNDHAPGFADLTINEREAITHFALLWSLFESDALNSSGSAKAIVNLAAYWVTQGAPAKDTFAESVAYFRNRYVKDGAFTDHFDHLHFRNGDRQELVERVLKGESDDPSEAAAAVLIVVYRYRNNYLHGMKWAYRMKDQLENFTHANTALIKALELHHRFGSAP